METINTVLTFCSTFCAMYTVYLMVNLHKRQEATNRNLAMLSYKKEAIDKLMSTLSDQGILYLSSTDRLDRNCLIVLNKLEIELQIQSHYFDKNVVQEIQIIIDTCRRGILTADNMHFDEAVTQEEVYSNMEFVINQFIMKFNDYMRNLTAETFGKGKN